MSIAIINGKKFSIENMSIAPTWENIIICKSKTFISQIEELFSLSNDKPYKKCVPVIDLTSNIFYPSLPPAKIRKNIIKAIENDKAYGEGGNIQVPESHFSYLTGEILVGHSFAYAINCPLEYLQLLAKNMRSKKENANDFNENYDEHGNESIPLLLNYIDALRKAIDTIEKTLISGEKVSNIHCTISDFVSFSEWINESLKELQEHENIKTKKLHITESTIQSIMKVDGINNVKQVYEIFKVMGIDIN